MSIEVSISGRLGAGFLLEIEARIPGEGVTALLGPSGSGKTSLLRALAGLDRHKGAIRFFDEIWQDKGRFVPPHRRGVGYVFQGAGLLPHLSVGDNLSFAARHRPHGPFRYDDVVAGTGIGDLLGRSPARLSGGEVQRAGIARALLSQPRLLLMDEPLTGLDVEARTGLLAVLECLFAAIPVPVVYVTHAEEEARRLAGTSIRLDAGRVVS